MVRSSIKLIKIVRSSSRNGKLQIITLAHRKLTCTCGDSTFSGIPCRHQLAFATKQEGISFENLPFNKVWRKDYFIEEKKDKEPERNFQENEGEENNQDQEILETEVLNVDENGIKNEEEEEKVDFNQV